jgi:hypothetical protein
VNEGAVAAVACDAELDAVGMAMLRPSQAVRGFIGTYVNSTPLAESVSEADAADSSFTASLPVMVAVFPSISARYACSSMTPVSIQSALAFFAIHGAFRAN